MEVHGYGVHRDQRLELQALVKGPFYPKDLKPSEWFKYFVGYFDTVEINNSFYRLPSEAVFQSWRTEVPHHFVFAVKASRFITQIKRLKDPEEPLALFFCALS